jgi:hypothetical protein
MGPRGIKRLEIKRLRRQGRVMNPALVVSGEITKDLKEWQDSGKAQARRKGSCKGW